MNAKQIADRIVNKGGSYQEVMSYAEGMISPLITRAEAAEARAVDLQARLDAMHSEYDAVKDEWHASLKRAAQAEAERDEALRKLDKVREASLELGRTLQFTRIGWDDTVTCEGVLEPINKIAFKIGNALQQTNDRIAAAVAAEREACAKVSESGRYIHGMMSGEIAYSRETARDIAAAIRARK